MNVTDFPILLVEDNPVEIAGVQNALAQANLVNPLRIVNDGRSAIAYLSGQGVYADRDSHPFPSLVLLDLTLPDLSGVEVHSWIRSQQTLKNLPVILLTAAPSDVCNDVPSAASGMDAFLAKPMDCDRLLEVMRSIGIYWMILDRAHPEPAPPAVDVPARHVLEVGQDGGVLRNIGSGPSPESTIAGSTRAEGRGVRMGRQQDTDILGHQMHFQNTSWDLVRAAPEKDALDALIRIYWKPLYFFVRRRGFANEEAKDIIQGFLANALEHGMILRADPLRGRFRTFLLAALNNFLKDRGRFAKRQKRGGGQVPLSLDLGMEEPKYARGVNTGEPPETIVDRAWAKDLLEQCISELEGKSSHLQAFDMQMRGVDYITIGKATGLSETAAKTAVHRLRVRLRGILRSHLSLKNATEEEVGRDVSEFASLLA